MVEQVYKDKSICLMFLIYIKQLLYSECGIRIVSCNYVSNLKLQCRAADLLELTRISQLEKEWWGGDMIQQTR